MENIVITIITISREFGSGGRIIGKLVSGKLGIEKCSELICTVYT